MNKSSFQKKYFDLENFRSEKDISRKKTEKIFSAHSDQSSIKHREKLFLGNIFKILDL